MNGEVRLSVDCWFVGCLSVRASRASPCRHLTAAGKEATIEKGWLKLDTPISAGGGILNSARLFRYDYYCLQPLAAFCVTCHMVGRKWHHEE